MEKIRAKNFGITKQEREAEMYDVLTLQHYILALKCRDLGELKCEECGNLEDLQIHHKRYGIDVTYYDLQLLCRNCHFKK